MDFFMLKVLRLRMSSLYSRIVYSILLHTVQSNIPLVQNMAFYC
jgi:hypothetical protein